MKLKKYLIVLLGNFGRRNLCKSFCTFVITKRQIFNKYSKRGDTVFLFYKLTNFRLYSEGVFLMMALKNLLKLAVLL